MEVLMRKRARSLGYWGLAFFAGFGCAAGSDGDPSTGSESGGQAGTGGESMGVQDAGTGGTIWIDVGGQVDDSSATGTEVCPGCTFPTCTGAAKTTVSGVVVTPAKINPDPLYNAVVYVPGAAVEPFSAGVTCDRCGNVSGRPIAATLSGHDGKFQLQGSIPVGRNVPLVIQLGRWRRQVTIPEVKECTDNPLPAELTRFPRNKSEGDIPLTALVTSTFDPVECILRKIGIDDSEFKLPGSDGRVHAFIGTGANVGAGTPTGTALWSDNAKLAAYDLVLLPRWSTPENLHAEMADGAIARKNLVDYAGRGGRVFLTDLSYTWISSADGAFGKTAHWYAHAADGNLKPDPLHVFIDTSFPKGEALAGWLQYVGATTKKGELEISEPYHRSDAVVAPTQRWLYSKSPMPATLQEFTFNTPVEAKPADQCGRVFYSSFHIANASNGLFGALPGEGNGSIFPAECDGEKPLTPQERVLEFMLFDLASCVQVDTDPPQPPSEIPR
jgi:hypothetical protein